MSKVPVKLRELVKQRLAAAAEEIFELLERTMREYEEELIYNYDKQRTEDKLDFAERGSPSVEGSEWSPEPLHFKEEQEEESSSQEALHRDIVTSQLWEREDTAPTLEFEEVPTMIQASIKSEKEEAPETWTQSHNQTVDCPEPPAPVAPSGDNLFHINNNDVMINNKLRGRRKLHSCSFCKLKFQSNFNLEAHMRVHTGEMPFSCSVCGKRYNRKDTLKKHLIIHSGIKPFSCPVCGKRFNDKSNMTRHMVTTHRDRT